jgi:hypothetical protein
MYIYKNIPDPQDAGRYRGEIELYSVGENSLNDLSTLSFAQRCGQMKFLEARSQQSERKTKLQFGASLCG